jgi:hypothetical protein
MLEEKLKETLIEFQSICLNEMDEVKLMNRVDTKFAFSFDSFEEILPHLKNNYKILEIEGTKTPFYKSLYFDTPNFDFYNAHHNGKLNRFKVRFRNYVESNLSFLEIKHKTKGRTKKKRIEVDEIHQTFNADEKVFLDLTIDNDFLLEPKLWNSFHRITLVNNDLKERLTLDFELKFFWEEKQVEFNNLVIAELKQEIVDRNSPFFSLMKARMIRPYRLSKYCIGSIELFGRKNIKYNRFKEKLIKLKSINKHD